MKIKQDPVTGLWCREDGAVLMPPTGCRRFPKFRWTYGSKQYDGYRAVRLHGKPHRVHRLICRAFNGLPPEDKPFVDHINRIRDDNRPRNLHWVDPKENTDNQARVDRSIAKYGIRWCEDTKGYKKAYNETHRAKMKAQGLVKRKGLDGKWGWYPKVHP